jgi:cephalosporin hydroxylase
MALTTLRRRALRNRLDRLLGRPPVIFERAVTRWFHRVFHYQKNRTWAATRFLGVPVAKCPFDLWTLQQIIFETRPDVVIETGTAHGGSAYYMARLFDLLGKGRVVSVDVEHQNSRPDHPRVTYLSGSSADPAVAVLVRGEVRPGETMMVVLDSLHTRTHVLAELRLYAPLVTPGCYLIVEDTNINGRPCFYAHGEGPGEAVEDYLKECHDFEPDPSREQYLLTFNPGGYLRRIVP